MREERGEEKEKKKKTNNRGVKMGGAGVAVAKSFFKKKRD